MSSQYQTLTPAESSTTLAIGTSCCFAFILTLPTTHNVSSYSRVTAGVFPCVCPVLQPDWETQSAVTLKIKTESADI